MKFEHGDHELVLYEQTTDHEEAVIAECSACRACAGVYSVSSVREEDEELKERFREAALEVFKDRFPDDCKLTMVLLVHET